MAAKLELDRIIEATRRKMVLSAHLTGINSSATISLSQELDEYIAISQQLKKETSKPSLIFT